MAVAQRTPADVLARALARRDLSDAEARAKLAGAGMDAAAVEDTLRRAYVAGWIDDARLAARLVERELEREPPPAVEWISERLSARGLPPAVVERAVAAADARVLAERGAAWLRAHARGGRVPARRLAGRLVRAGHAPEMVEEWLAASGLLADPDHDGGAYSDDLDRGDHPDLD